MKRSVSLCCEDTELEDRVKGIPVPVEKLALFIPERYMRDMTCSIMPWSPESAELRFSIPA